MWPKVSVSLIKVYTGKNNMQVRAFERYIPLMYKGLYVVRNGVVNIMIIIQTYLNITVSTVKRSGYIELVNGHDNCVTLVDGKIPNTFYCWRLTK